MSRTPPTIIAWATDLHLDAAEPGASRAFCAGVRASGARALLVGGDIATAPDLELRLRDLADAVGMPIHFVLGNHDYYGGSIAAVRARMGALDHPGLHWLPAAGPRELAPGSEPGRARPGNRLRGAALRPSRGE